MPIPASTGARGPTTLADAASDEVLAVSAGKGDLVARNELLRRYSTMLRIKARGYSRAPVPEAAIEGEAMKLLLYAAEKFNPKGGTQFKTFLDTYLRGLYRYTARNQNIARIPEHQVMEIRRYKNTKDIISSQKDREPTHEEMADALGWSPAQVQRLESNLSRRDVAASGMVTTPEVKRLNEKMEELLEFEYFSRMSPTEKLVYDYSLGRHGRVRLESVKDMAKRIGVTEGEVYAAKRTLAHKVMARL